MAEFESSKLKKSSVRTRTAFLNALLWLMKRKPFDDISVSALIERAGYSRTTFYSYYQDKFDMLEKIMDEEAVNFVSAVCYPIPTDDTMRFDSNIFLPGLSLFRHVAERKDLYYLLIHNKLPGQSTDSLTRRISKVFQKVLSVEITEPPPNLNYDLYCYITSDTYLAFIKYWEMHDFSYSPEYMAEQMMENFVKLKKVSGVYVRNLPPPFNIWDAMK